MQPFTREAINGIKKIPPGKVMTYGQIAELAGNKRAARQVVRLLHAMSKAYNLPWHRVVNAKGQIAIQDDESRFLQALLLQEEGVEVSESGCVNLTAYRFIPDPPSEMQ